MNLSSFIGLGEPKYVTVFGLGWKYAKLKVLLYGKKLVLRKTHIEHYFPL